MFSHQSSTVVSELPKDALVHVLSGCSAHEHGAIRLCSLEWKRMHEQHVTTRLRAGSIPDRVAVYRLECRAFVSELDLSSPTCNITPGCSLADFIGEASTGCARRVVSGYAFLFFCAVGHPESADSRRPTPAARSAGSRSYATSSSGLRRCGRRRC